MMSETNEVEATREKQNGETFSEEMKDYAKSTMNELLGMFGYEEEITREAVEELQIRLLPEEDDNAQSMIDKSVELEKDDSVPVNINAGENTVLVEIPGIENGSKPSVIPVPDINNAAIPNDSVVQPLSEVPINSPAETSKPGTVLNETRRAAASSSDWSDKREGEPTAGVQITYTSPPGKDPLQKVQVCSWCKKSTVLKDFTSSDGEKIISCKSLCSALCFEQAVKNIKESEHHINSTQDLLRTQGLPGSNRSVSLKPPPSAPLTRSASKGSTPDKSKNNSPTTPNLPPAQAGPKGLFSWDEYLAQTDSVAAPWSCFKQSSTPPYNGFQKNMKLEVADPRIVDTMCVATVVGILGPRIRCRFDGTDSANDVWHLVDSKEIHPVGWCEGNGGRLQPPVGFKLDPGKYSSFLARALANAELAPVRLFKREPTPPKENLFKVGMKLEALDPKNPLLVCVATVAGVDGDKIRVDFDGYLGSDYWCRYDSRDIFPVGWCYYSGHPLQPPGKTKKALKNLNVKSKDKADKTVRPVKPDKPEKQDKKKPPAISSPTAVSAATTPVPTPTVPTLSGARRTYDPPSPMEEADQIGVNYTVQVFINHSCLPGPYLSPAKVASLPSCFRGTVLNVARDCFQSIVNAGVQPTAVFKLLKPGTGKTRITCKDGKQTLTCFLQVIDRVSRFWAVLDKLAENLQCCENLFSGERITGPCSKCGRSASRRNTVLPETLPIVAKKSTAGVKRGAYKRRDEAVKRTRITMGEGIGDEYGDDVSSPTIESTSPPKTWSVDEVVKFIEKSELAEHAGMFKTHEIDGKALLLLTREMIMSYMGLKLGPAIKLLGCIEELKAKISS